MQVELKLRWTKHCVLAFPGVENNNADSNNITVTMKDPTLYVPVVTLRAKEKQKLIKHLSKEFERSIYWNEYETKTERATNEYWYFLESKFVGGLLYSNQDVNSKRYISQKYCITKYY